ncbi:DUF2336 domain-containing protein [Sneathiella sp. P13V-1]|uniref:DUF2336 domain-containing protein n=1 Tax=Sneathiella sp. P13V-1 TaxID=2697366 RepID=UPI00187B839A|nr:DUF2336 domain-containing protein [Sneathiella sp. P13V-1]MBE7636477.1 DUF2336 domain-containing protein [Sneathiella sp. P13V-1]
MQTIAIDVTDVDLYMSQTERERHFAAQSVADKFLNTPVDSPNHATYEKLLKLPLGDKDEQIQNHVASLVAKSPTLSGGIAVQIILSNLNPTNWLLHHFENFTESDLYTLVLAGSQSVRDAIAERPDLTHQLTDYICKYCELSTVEICLKNMSSPITGGGYRNLLDRFASKYPGIIKLILSRKSLPESLIKPILSQTDMDLQEILAAFKTVPIEIENRAIDTKEEQKLASVIDINWPVKLKRKAIHQLYEDGRLTHTLMLRKYLALDGEFLVIALSSKSGRSEQEITDLLHEGKEKPLSKILKQSSPPEHLIPAFKKITPQILRMKDASIEEKEILRANFLHQLKNIYNFHAPMTIEEIFEKLHHFGDI